MSSTFFFFSYYHKPRFFPMAQFITKKNVRELFTKVKLTKMDKSDTGEKI